MMCKIHAEQCDSLACGTTPTAPQNEAHMGVVQPAGLWSQKWLMSVPALACCCVAFHELLQCEGILQTLPSTGACGITANTLYNVYLVAQDFVVPTPNIQAEVSLVPLDTSDTSGGFTCSAGQFASRLRPDIVPVGASPGLPASRLYGNWTATRSMQYTMLTHVVLAEALKQHMDCPIACRYAAYQCQIAGSAA